MEDGPARRRSTCPRISPRRGYGRLLPPPVVLPQLRCVNWNATVCAPLSTRPYGLQKPALSSSELHPSNSKFFPYLPPPVAVTPLVPLFSFLYALVGASGGEAAGTAGA